MHPGMMAWWHARRHAACGEGASCGPHEWQGWHAGPYGRHGGGGGEDFGGGNFGVRRPLRLLATILDELKIERAQAAVDQRRTTAALAEAVAGEVFDEAKAKGAADERVKSNERVQAAVARALGRIHALLDTEQRSKLAYLLRTGALSI
jgi:Spy/CpxP family protein refolding chaperone